jgi:hypothetical protein
MLRCEETPKFDDDDPTLVERLYSEELPFVHCPRVSLPTIF